MLSSDDFVKSPSAALRFAGKVLNVQKVRLRLFRLARLAYRAFYEAAGSVFVRDNMKTGFTLLEVLVSLLIIAIVFVSVLRLQGQSISMNETTRFYAVAPFLAQQKMSEITADPEAFSGSQTGDFGEDAPGYGWEARVEDFPITDPDGGEIMLSRAEVVVTRDGSGRKFSLDEYLSEARKGIQQ